ncbi:MAG TPA: thiol-activated cytolysin family protein, partial [Oscillospiraceae bacterium]|nr:thiol-activated cytolysin family protein [Oscillospiraceae bacterium]
QEAAKQEAAKQEAAKQEAAKQEAAKQEAAKQEAAKQEAAKQEAAKQEAAKQEAAKKEAASKDDKVENTKATAPNPALMEQLSTLKNPDGITSAAKPTAIKEAPLGEAKEESRKTGTTTDGVPVTYVTTTQKFKASAAFDQQILLNPSTDVIYPGSVLLGDTIASGTYQEVTKGTKRPITISYDLTNVKKSNGKTGKISDTIFPSLSNYRKLHGRIMNQDLGKISTTYSFEATEVYSDSDFGVKFNFGVGFNSGVVETSIKSGFEFNKGSKKRKYMVKFMETFYTVDVDQGNGTFLYENFNIKDFNGFRPVYVSSIAYGRLAYLTIESDKSWSTIKTSLEAEVDAKLYGKYNADVKTENKKEEGTDKINVTIIGADSSEIVSDLPGFMKWVTEKGYSKDRTGKIIAYKLRFVDNNAVANTVYNDEYTLTKTVEQLGKGIETTLTLYKIKTNANDGNGKAMELYGNLEMTDGKSAQSFWSFPRAQRKKYKEVGESSENGVVKYVVPNENATLDLTLQLSEADGSAKDDDSFTNAMGTVEGNVAKKITVSDLKDGEDIVIRSHATKKKKKNKTIVDNEWVDFYIKVSKKNLY